MNECHETDCPQSSYTPTSCRCGFTARLLRGEASVASADRGQGGKERYSAPLSSTRGALMDPELLTAFLAGLSARARA